MSLIKTREERKKLGFGVKRGTRTITLVLLLILVLLAIVYLDRIA